MYGIFTYIWAIDGADGGKYCIHGAYGIPSGKRLHNYGKSPFLTVKLTISMAIFNSKLLVITRG